MKTKRLFLSLVTMFVTAVSWADVAINETNFPDENFRNYLINDTYSVGSDGILTDTEIQNINLINVDNKDISSLKGIEFFTSMTWLTCSNNQLTSLDVSKCTALTTLCCDNNQLTSLDVSGCTALTTLYCFENQLTSLDVSGCTALKYLYCYNNQLTSLDVSKCTAMSYLKCQNNQLTSIDVSKNTSLSVRDSDISGNPLTGVVEGSCGSSARYSLNLGTGVFSLTGTGAMNDYESSSNPTPWFLYNKYVKTVNIANGITRIGVRAFRKCRNMTSVSIPNSVTSIGESAFGHCDALTSFTLPNSVTEVGDWIFEDVDNFPVTVYNSSCFVILQNSYSGAYTIPAGIKTICGGAFTGCKLTSVTIPSSVTKIGEEAFAKTGLTSVTIPSSVTTICKDAFEQCKNLKSVTIPNSVTSIEEGAFKECTAITSINSKIKTPFAVNENVFQYRDSSYNYQTLPATLYVPVGTKSLYASTAGWSLFTNIVEEGGDVPVAINETNFPDVNFRNYLLSQGYGSDGVLTYDEIADIENMNVSKKGIKSLKGIEYFIALTSLSCYENQLTSLDVTRNTALTGLACDGNQLTSLDVSKNTALTKFECCENLLTSLDVSKNVALKYLDCSYNQLTSLVLSQNAQLNEIVCFNNRIKGENMDVLIISSPGAANKGLYIISDNNEGNVMTTTQVAAAKAKGWTPYYAIDVEKWEWQEYSGSDEPIEGDIPINEVNFPDKNFRNWILSQTYGSDKKLTEEEIRSVTRISIDYSSINSLKGIEHFIALTYLSCSSNSGITSIDISNNIALERLYLDRCGLTSLDLSKNTKLIEFSCKENQLTSLDLSNNIKLKSLDCHDNKLTTIDLSNNILLEYVDCSYNQLSTLDLRKNSLLDDVDCSHNKLTSLYVDYIGKEYGGALDCSNNLLSELSVYFNKFCGFDCSNNKLTSLWFHYSSIYLTDPRISIYGNQLNNSAMQTFINNLYIVNHVNNGTGTLKVLAAEDGNEMTIEQAAFVKERNWIPLCLDVDSQQWMEYTGSEPVPVEKCATPTISIFEGKLHFSCETEGVTYISHVEMPSSFDSTSENVNLPKIKVTVYATKSGCENSDVAVKEIIVGGASGIRGDVNNDGQVSMPDAMFIVNKILNGKFPDE